MKTFTAYIELNNPFRFDRIVSIYENENPSQKLKNGKKKWFQNTFFFDKEYSLSL
jgi:hypothetical protein